jgi:hypothetical protein
MTAAVLERRRKARMKVFEISIIAIDGVAYRAHLLDISDAGARVHCRTPLSIGQSVLVRAPQGEHKATVRWIRANGMVGVQFR